MSLQDALRAGEAPIFEAALTSVAADFRPETTPRAPSTDPLGYDVSCVEDIDELAREVSGEEMLAEAWARRLNTPRGSLGDDDPDYGLDCVNFLHKPMTAAEIAAIPGLIKGELLKDERCYDVTVRMVRFDQELGFECELDGVAATGPFEFVLAATPENLSILLKGQS